MASHKIGRYRTVAALGRGGMSEVFLTVSEGPFNFNKLLVVKQLRHELTEDEQFRAMFLDEARLAARLNHPNVVQTYEVGADDNGHFIAMEYIDGQPLHAVLRRLERKLALGQHITILSHVLSALDYAHDLRDFDGKALSIVHRDVSPQNVIVTYEGQVKLVDFGVAKSSIAVSETQAGVVKGKAAYMAPEQMSFGTIDRRADIFAIGVMLWEAIAERRLVPPDQDGEQVFLRRLRREEPRVTEVVPDAPPELVEIVDRAMAVSPDDRYQTAAEMRAALDAYLDKNGRASSSDLATLMRELFAKERAAMERKVTEQLARTEGSEASMLSLSVPRWNATDATPAPQAESSVGTQPSAPKSKAPWVIAIASVASALIIAGAVIMGSRPAEQPTAPASPPPAEARVTPEEPAPQPTAETTTAAAVGTDSAPSATAPSGKAPAPVGQPRQPPTTWAKTNAKGDRSPITDLSLEPPKPKRQLDEKDPYAE